MIVNTMHRDDAIEVCLGVPHLLSGSDFKTWETVQEYIRICPYPVVVSELHWTIQECLENGLYHHSRDRYMIITEIEMVEKLTEYLRECGCLLEGMV